MKFSLHEQEYGVTETNSSNVGKSGLSPLLKLEHEKQSYSD